MQLFVKNTLRIVALAALLCRAAVVSAASPAGGVDPSSLDVAGVKLGMSVDEALTALHGFDAGYNIVKRYADREVTFGFYGVPIETINTKDVAYLIGIHATKDEGADHEEVFVYLAPVPDKERVILVSRAKQFGQPQLASSIADGLFSKYPKDTTFDKQASSGNPSRGIGWRFDTHGRIMSSTVARQEGVATGIDYREYTKPTDSRPRSIGALILSQDVGGGRAPGYDLFPQFPGTVASDGGVALDAAIGSPRDNSALATGFNVVLYQGSALFGFAQQAKTTFTQKQSQHDQAKQQQEIEKAKSSPGAATKF